MKIDSVHILFWSYSGATEAFAAHMAADIRARGWEPRLCNLLKDKPDTVSFSQRDLLIMLCPVFAGRLPAHAAAFLKSLSGDRAPALAAVTYGNREYEDALLELCDGLENQGFCLAGAAALVAQHSIFPKAARGRPDEADKMKTSFFLLQILQKFSSCEQPEDLEKLAIPGNRPYKDVSAVRIPLKPKTSSKCTRCGLCAKICPAHAIDPQDPQTTDTETCISCTACIANCPAHARKFPTLVQKVGEREFCRQNSLRKEPAFFL